MTRVVPSTDKPLTSSCLVSLTPPAGRYELQDKDAATQINDMSTCTHRRQGLCSFSIYARESQQKRVEDVVDFLNYYGSVVEALLEPTKCMVLQASVEIYVREN